MLEQLSNTALSVWIRESTELYGYTLILSLHALGLAVVVGVSTAVALRLLGMAPGIPLNAAKRLFRVIYVGFGINAVSGGLLFIAEPAKMASMPAFWLKLFFVACGMVVASLLTRWVFGDAGMLASGVPNRIARKLAYASLTSWYLALIVGRMTGYPELVGQMLKSLHL